MPSAFSFIANSGPLPATFALNSQIALNISLVYGTSSPFTVVLTRPASSSACMHVFSMLSSFSFSVVWILMPGCVSTTWIIASLKPCMRQMSSSAPSSASRLLQLYRRVGRLTNSIRNNCGSSKQRIRCVISLSGIMEVITSDSGSSSSRWFSVSCITRFTGAVWCGVFL